MVLLESHKFYVLLFLFFFIKMSRCLDNEVKVESMKTVKTCKKHLRDLRIFWERKIFKKIQKMKHSVFNSLHANVIIFTTFWVVQANTKVVQGCFSKMSKNLQIRGVDPVTHTPPFCKWFLYFGGGGEPVFFSSVVQTTGFWDYLTKRRFFRSIPQTVASADFFEYWISYGFCYVLKVQFIYTILFPKWKHVRGVKIGRRYGLRNP